MWSNRKKYRVKLMGRAGLIYEEDGRSMIIDSEMLAGPDFDIVIYLDSLDVMIDSNKKKLIAAEDKIRIKENIANELIKFRIDWK
jgi:hypothetical protein